MGNCSNIAVPDVNSSKPRWTHAVQFRDEFLRDKISAFSLGFRPINNNTVELVGSETNKIDGARWSRGFSSGRHVIEFIYPVHLRTEGARVGLGTKCTILGGNDVTNIVGGQGSLAVDLVTKKVIQNNKVVARFPRNKVLPDWFFMYLDIDNGTMQFGSDTEFFGTAFSGVMPTDEPLYPIVTGSKKGAIISIVYRGKGKDIEGPLRKNRSRKISNLANSLTSDSKSYKLALMR
ncbi:protein gustavus-like [Mercenaria mercenaria]|uniref:protein gustavus-like n=1 Tax=Mercenaria mercenaria TaxID=6596 RepID=UPI00234F9F32|nr:protein gustavus-like [Mercenaria mercenaria]